MRWDSPIFTYRAELRPLTTVLKTYEGYSNYTIFWSCWFSITLNGGFNQVQSWGKDGQFCYRYHWYGWHGQDVCPQAQRCWMEVNPLDWVFVEPAFAMVSTLLFLTFTPFYNDDLSAFGSSIAFIWPDYHSGTRSEAGFPWWKISATLFYFVWINQTTSAVFVTFWNRRS